MKNPFEVEVLTKLPHHWCVKVGIGLTPEEVYDWARHGTWWGNDGNNRNGGVGYINQYGFWTKEKNERDTEITLEQFREWVINTHQIKDEAKVDYHNWLFETIGLETIRGWVEDALYVCDYPPSISLMLCCRDVHEEQQLNNDSFGLTEDEQIEVISNIGF